MVRILFCFRNEQSSLNDLFVSFAGNYFASAATRSLGGGLTLPVYGRGTGLLGFRKYFWRATHVACFDSVRLLRRNGFGDLVGSKETFGSLAYWGSCLGRSRDWSFSLRLYAAFFVD